MKRMHSSCMRTDCCSGRRGGGWSPFHPGTYLDRDPRPLQRETPLRDRDPPPPVWTCKHLWMVIFPDTKIQRYLHCTSSTFFPCIYQYLQRYGKKVDDVHCRYLCGKHGDLTKHKETAKNTGNLPTTQRQFCNFKINTVWKY